LAHTEEKTMRFTTALVTLAAAAVLSTTGAVGAHAQQRALLSCPADSVCFWEGSHFTGKRTVKQHPHDPGVCGAVEGGFARSLINNTKYPRQLYAAQSCPEDQLVTWVAPGGAEPDLAPAAVSWR
jgi:hypothetical protein